MLSNTLKKQSTLFAKCSKSFEDIEKVIPFTAIVVNLKFVVI